MDYYDLFMQGPSVFIPAMLLSLLITMLGYGAFPIIFSIVRKKQITKRKFTLLCYAINLIVMIAFIAFGSRPSVSPYMLWTWIFSSIGLRILEKGKLKQKINHIPKGVKVSVAYFVSNLMTKGIAYLTLPIFIRLLTPEEYGSTSLFMTWLELLEIVALFCLNKGIFNNGMVDYPDKRDEYSYSMLILSNVITAIFSVVLIAVYPFIKQYIMLDFPLVLLMIVMFFFQPAYIFWSKRQRFEYKYKATSLATILLSVLPQGVAIIAVMLTRGSRLYARLFGAECVAIAVYMFFYALIASRSRFKLKTSYWKEAFIFNLPLIPHYLSTYLLGHSDKLMISNLVGTAATAYYGVAHSIAAVILVVWNAINTSLIPFTYEKCKESKYKEISDVTIPILLVFAGVSVFVNLMAPELLGLIATESYKTAVYVIPPLLGGIFFQVQYFVYANIVYYHKKPKYVMMASITATVLNIILNYIFIKKYGFIAAGYTTLVCFIVQAIIDYFAMRKVVGSSVYDMRYIILLSVVVLIISLTSGMLYSFIIIRYIIVVALLAVTVIFRKYIISIIKRLKK